MVIKSYEDGDILRHALGQLYGSMRYLQENLEVDDSITRESSSDNNNPNNLDINILGSVNEIFKANHLYMICFFCCKTKPRAWPVRSK